MMAETLSQIASGLGDVNLFSKDLSPLGNVLRLIKLLGL